MAKRTHLPNETVVRKIDRYAFKNVHENKTLQRLQKKLVDRFDYTIKKEASFCDSCVEGKHHRSRFPVSETKQTREPLCHS